MKSQSNAAAIDQSRILVAEDNPTNALMIEAVLQHFGCEFEIVGAGDKAVERVKQGDIDIVLLDFHMPGLNGAQAATAIREWEHQERGRRIYIVGLTATALPSEMTYCLSAGMDQVVSKPFDIEYLRRVLQRGSQISRQAELSPDSTSGPGR
ncbi:MAG: response regulator [Burkholderiales bacterium]|nr:MAG: response regulator [Burkholderiales bacterium]